MPITLAVPSPWVAQHFTELNSTNDTARAAAEKGAADNTMIVADTQTAGRGRLGRVWQSPPGNIYASFIWRPQVPLARLAEIGFVASLAVADTLQHFAPMAQVSLKWPNDVLMDGQKIAGLLLESDGQSQPGYIICGIGVNLEHAPPPETVSYPATCLAAHTAAVPDCDVFLALLCQALNSHRRCWQSEGFAAIRTLWLQRAHQLWQEITVRQGNEILTGIFTGLDETGNLLLTQGPNLIRISAADVLFT